MQIVVYDTAGFKQGFESHSYPAINDFLIRFIVVIFPKVRNFVGGLFSSRVNKGVRKAGGVRYLISWCWCSVLTCLVRPNSNRHFLQLNSQKLLSKSDCVQRGHTTNATTYFRFHVAYIHNRTESCSLKINNPAFIFRRFFTPRWSIPNIVHLTG